MLGAEGSNGEFIPGIQGHLCSLNKLTELSMQSYGV